MVQAGIQCFKICNKLYLAVPAGEFLQDHDSCVNLLVRWTDGEITAGINPGYEPFEERRRDI